MDWSILLKDFLLQLGYFYMLFTLSQCSDPPQIQEVCNMETFKAQCRAEDEVIEMASARYGRMRKGRCVRVTYGTIGCQSDVTRYFDTLCSGRRKCEVKVPDDNIYALAECPRDVTSYLEASFRCKKVTMSQDLMSMCHSDGVVRVTEQEGVIASVMVAELRSGSNPCPWIIQALPGQKINITLLDFGSVKDDPSASFRPSCHKYGVIRERDVSSPTIVCSDKVKERNLYLSQTNRVEIQFEQARTGENAPHFLLKYNVVGCPEPVLRGNTLIKRTSGRAVLECNLTGQKWTLHCHGAKWNGQPGNCTAPGANWSVWHILSEEWASPQGILITVGLGVALGTVIGVSLLVCVLICLKRRRKLHQRSKFQQTTQDVDYDGRDCLDADDNARKWEDENKTPDTGYSRQSSVVTYKDKDGHYSQVWSDPTGGNPDPVLDPRQDQQPIRLPGMVPHAPLVRLPTPPNLQGLYDRSEHVYEKPK